MSDPTRSRQPEEEAVISAGLKRFSTLPDWLALIRDHHRTFQVLSRDIPEFAQGRITLRKCKIGHLQYREGTWPNRCTVKYRVDGEPDEHSIELNGILYPPGILSEDQPIAEGIFGTQEWYATLPELNLKLAPLAPETELVSLDLLTDAEKAREFLERSLRSASPAYHNIRIQSCHPEITRYKPGDRCTILYHLEYAPDMPADVHAPPILVAKTTRQEKERNAFAALSALWNASFGRDGIVRIAEPIAYDAELKVFVQGPVREEQTLADLLLSALDEDSPNALQVVDETMRKTAEGLADLHQSGVEIGQPIRWDDEMKEVEAELTPLYTVFPELSSAAAPFLEHIRRLEASTSPDSFVPSHGTFRPVQVLLNKEEISFIDFDSFCQSEPARDLSMFLTSFMTLTLASDDQDGKIADPAHWNARFERVTTICDQFLTAYEQRRPVSRQRVALWEALNLFYLVVTGWTKVKTGEIQLLVRLLDCFLTKSRLIDTG